MSITKFFLAISLTLYFTVSHAQVMIPDTSFERRLLVLGYDTDGILNGQISMSDAEAVTFLSIDNSNISDLTGIEGFINLHTLSSRNNQITELDLSNNPAFAQLDCYNNQLIRLDVSNNSALTFLNLFNNQLTDLDVSNNPALINLFCERNQLALLNVSNNPALRFLNCSNNQLTELDIRNGSTSTIRFINALDNANLYCILVDDVAFANRTFTEKDAQATFTDAPDDLACIPPETVPTLSQWAVILLSLFLMIMGIVGIKEQSYSGLI